MDKRFLTFFPYPHVYEGERREGTVYQWPARCEMCRNRQCERSESYELQTCSYGYDFQRVDASLLIAGILLRDRQNETKSRQKARRRATAMTSAGELNAVVGRALESAADEREWLDGERHAIVEEYRQSGRYKDDLAELLKPSIEQTFAQVHDYRQLISQIVQHVNVYLETKYPGGDSLQDKLALADDNIRSIYWAARLMEFKLLSALFLVYPEQIDDPRKKRSFRLHGAVHKYLQIYKPLMEVRSIRLRVVGDSYANLVENPDAVGVIPQAFIDNAVKYAGSGSELYVYFDESPSSIAITVESEGPEIRTEERARIFDLFYRGRAAVDTGEEGTGFGLGLAMLVGERIGAKLSFTQDEHAGANGLHKTAFRADFARPIEGEDPPSIVKARDRQPGGQSPFVT
ncbi:hypothetical protein GXP71_14310 [Cellulomonas sp. H30R-01]|uniref:sensor histidine kinase n=1 Tax=Cellulomonas sp. H30R-01 TaxID=2704467 RepID=UPI00138C2347|nr:HAMP domain-containing sensor histidine kinase [Cellulomonas sp. H30R-01]QHT57138.1 hypothetical protein GXP71_14310 [Cellulomonas sp. H30R-01]